MKTERLKKEIAKAIESCDDIDKLGMIYELLTSKPNPVTIVELTEAERKAVEEAHEAIRNGERLIPHKEVKKMIRERFPSLYQK